MAVLDCNGRIADRDITHALGWEPSIRLDIRETGGLLILHRRPDGVFRMTADDHLRLPAAARCCYGLASRSHQHRPTRRGMGRPTIPGPR